MSSNKKQTIKFRGIKQYYSGCSFLSHQSGRSWYCHHQLKWTTEPPASVIESSSILGSSVQSACPVSLLYYRGRHLRVSSENVCPFLMLPMCVTCSPIQSPLDLFILTGVMKASHSGCVVHDLNCLHLLKHWGAGFRFYLRHGCLSVYILCLCYPMYEGESNENCKFFLNLIYWMKAAHNYINFLHSLHFVQYRPSS
jgi:hypothetical protein